MKLFYGILRWAGYGAAILSGTSAAAYAQSNQPLNQLYAGVSNDGSIGKCGSNLVTFSPDLRRIYFSYDSERQTSQDIINAYLEGKSSSALSENNLRTRMGGNKDKCDAALKVLNSLRNDDPLYKDMYETVLDASDFRFVISEKIIEERHSHVYLMDSNEIILSEEALSLGSPELDLISIRQKMFYSFLKGYNEIFKNNDSTEIRFSLTENEVRDIYHEMTDELGEIKTIIENYFKSGEMNQECKKIKAWLTGNLDGNSYHTPYTVVYYADNLKDYQDIKNKRADASKKCKSQDINVDYNKYNGDVTVIREWDEPGKAYYIQYKYDDPLMYFHNQMTIQAAAWKRMGEHDFDAGFTEMVGSIISYLPPKAIEKYFPTFHGKLTRMVGEMKQYRNNNKESLLNYHDDSYTSECSEEISKMNAMLKFMKKSNDYRKPKVAVEEMVRCRLEIISKFINNKDRILFEHPGYYKSVMDFFEALTKNSWDNGKWKDTAISLRETLKSLKKERTKEPIRAYKAF